MPLDTERVAEAVSQTEFTAQENQDHFRENESDFTEKYGGMVVAVLGGKVVETTQRTDVEGQAELRRTLVEDYGEGAADRAFIKQVPDENETLVL